MTGQSFAILRFGRLQPSREVLVLKKICLAAGYRMATPSCQTEGHTRHAACHCKPPLFDSGPKEPMSSHKQRVPVELSMRAPLAKLPQHPSCSTAPSRTQVQRGQHAPSPPFVARSLSVVLLTAPGVSNTTGPSLSDRIPTPGTGCVLLVRTHCTDPQTRHLVCKPRKRFPKYKPKKKTVASSTGEPCKGLEHEVVV